MNLQEIKQDGESYKVTTDDFDSLSILDVLKESQLKNMVSNNVLSFINGKMYVLIITPEDLPKLETLLKRKWNETLWEMSLTIISIT